MSTKSQVNLSEKEQTYNAIADLILEHDRERAKRVKSAHPDLAPLFDDAKERAVFLKASGTFTISGDSKLKYNYQVVGSFQGDPYYSFSDFNPSPGIVKTTQANG